MARSTSLVYSFIYILFLYCFTINADDEYTKREYSLIQPYFGKYFSYSHIFKYHLSNLLLISECVCYVCVLDYYLHRCWIGYDILGLFGLNLSHNKLHTLNT